MGLGGGTDQGVTFVTPAWRVTLATLYGFCFLRHGPKALTAEGQTPEDHVKVMTPYSV